MNRRNYLLTALAGTMGGAAAAAESPDELIWSPETIPWQREEYGGAKYAVLDGDRDLPGQPFTYAFWMPANLWVPAHTHTQQAHVAVLKGALLLGFGRKQVRTATRRIPAGGFFVVRAGVAHFEGCTEDTLLIGSAMGGWKTRELESR